MEISSVNYKPFRPNQEQLRKMQLYRPSGRNPTCGFAITVQRSNNRELTVKARQLDSVAQLVKLDSIVPFFAAALS
jgi:hypothetical protein